MASVTVPPLDIALAELSGTRAAADKAVARVAELERQVQLARVAVDEAIARAGESLADAASDGDASMLGADVSRLRSEVDVLEVALRFARKGADVGREAVAVAEGKVAYARLYEATLELEARNWAFARVIGAVDAMYGQWLPCYQAVDEARGVAESYAAVLARNGVEIPLPAPRVNAPAGLGQVTAYWRDHVMPEFRRSAGRLVNAGDVDAVAKRAPSLVLVDPVPYPEDIVQADGASIGGIVGDVVSIPARVVARVRQAVGAPS